MSVLYLDCTDGVSDELLLAALADLGARVGERPAEPAQAGERTRLAQERLEASPGPPLCADELGRLSAVFSALDGLAPSAIHASPLPAPGGTHTSPIALRVLAGTGARLVPDTRTAELVTPLGAAVLAVAAEFRTPAMTLAAVGHARSGPAALTAWLGEPVEEAAEVCVIETNIDDMPPTHLAALAEDLMAAAALDVSITPTLMKKGRPGHLVTVVARPEEARELARMLLAGSTTLGVRLSRAERIIAGRRFLEVETPMGRVRVKVKELDGRPVDVAPEYEDCRRLGDVREVARLASAIARRELGL